MPLTNLKALVTSGPTYEPIDPVRFIGNHSSGKQGHAIAAALAKAGADVTLISGPVTLPDPAGVKTLHVETAQDMLAACESALPTDIAICAAAVGDWRVKTLADHKLKKRENTDELTLTFIQNPDILKTLSNHKNRPKLIVGFASETNDLIDNAQAKLQHKGCDWILANDVSAGKTFGADENHVYLITQSETQEWPRARKSEIAQTLVQNIIKEFK